jgi:hypothetical protein
VKSTPSLHLIPERSFTVISVKSLLYCGLSAASELSQTLPLSPWSGSMYQSVSMHSCWSPVEVPFGFGTQTLKFDGSVTVPSGFSAMRT